MKTTPKAMKFLAKQLGNPSGMFGQWVLAPLWNYRNSALNDAAFNCLALRPQDRVLEVGFGGGYLLGRIITRLTTGFLAGVDASTTMIALGEKRFRSSIQTGRLELICAQAEALPYPSMHFTKACSVNSIFYWQNATQALSEFWRVLADDGQLVMCFTCKEYLAGKAFARNGITLYEADEVRQLLVSAGFCEIQLTRHADRHREFWCITSQR